MQNNSQGRVQRVQEKRGGIRHKIPRYVEVFVRGKPYVGTILNQSRGGVFIQVRGTFTAGEDLFLMDPSTPSVMQKRKARIARVASDGIGVLFERPGYF